MLWRLVESFNDNLALLLLIAVGLAFAAGGLPPMMERRRRRSIEGALPGFLEALSDGVGAGLGLQEVMSDQSDNQPGAFGALLRESLSKSHVTSFDAALASFATSTRSSQVQRVIQLIQTAVEQNSPLQSVLYDLANDYQRLNDLIDKREKDLSGLVMTIVLFICIGLQACSRSSSGCLRLRVQATKSTTSRPCSLSSSAPRAPLLWPSAAGCLGACGP